MVKLGAGADGAKWTKKGPAQEFKTNIGIVVAVKDHESFPAKLSQAISAVCNKNGLPWDRPFCKGSDLRHVAGRDALTVKVIEGILHSVRSELERVLIVYTLLFP